MINHQILWSNEYDPTKAHQTAAAALGIAYGIFGAADEAEPGRSSRKMGSRKRFSTTL